MKNKNMSPLLSSQHARPMTLPSLVLGVALLPLCVYAQQPNQSPEPPPRLIAPVIPQRGAAMSSLQRLVRMALDRSPSGREAQANWRAAQQDVEKAKAGLFPQVELNANTAATKLDNGSADAIKAGLGAVASYTLYDFGRIQRGIDASQSQASVMQARILLAREATTFETVNAYFELLKYERLIRIHERYALELADLVGKLSEIVAVFEGRASELTQAQTRLGQARDALNVLKAKKRESQLALLRQVGPQATSITSTDALPDIPVEPLSNVLDQALKQHPLMAAAKGEAESATALIAQAQAAREPQVDMQLAKQTGRNALNQSYPLQLYVSAKWAAFQGFGDKAAELALMERAAAANERVAQLQIELDFNVKSAWADYEAQASRANDLRNLVKGTDRVRQDYYIQWRDLGKRSLLDVLSAENEHLNTQLSLASSEVDQVLALARMKYEAGALKEWLVGDEGQAIAYSDPVKTQQPVLAVVASSTAPIPAPAPVPAAVPALAQLQVPPPEPLPVPVAEKVAAYTQPLPMPLQLPAPQTARQPTLPAAVLTEKPSPKAIEMAVAMAENQAMTEERSTTVFAVAPTSAPTLPKVVELPSFALVAPVEYSALVADEQPLPVAKRTDELGVLLAQGWGP
jgi:outer membrane protein, adhesin transport system